MHGDAEQARLGRYETVWPRHRVSEVSRLMFDAVALRPGERVIGFTRSHTPAVKLSA